MLARVRTALTGLAVAAALTLGTSVAPAQAAIPTDSITPGDLEGISAVVPLSAEERISNWQELQFGLFMHWGVYSMFEGSYKGQAQGIGYPEQIKAWMNIPDTDYLAEAAKMTADKWDAAAICQTAKDTGMKYVKITTKHHDGFAMWDTATTDYNVVKKTAFGKDPIKQLATECNKIGIDLAFYFSIIDWTRQTPEPYQNMNPIDDSMMPLIHDQLTELLSNYGPISELWFDMGKPTAAQSQQMVDWVNQLQPETVVNSRVWNDKGDFEVGGDNAVASELRTGPWESILSIFPNCWSYCSTSKANRAENQILPKSRSAISSLATVISGGGQFAYNIGPKGDGSFDPFDKHVLDNVGAWMKRHPDAITGAQATWFPVADWGRMTAKGSDLYLMVPNWQDGRQLTLKGLANEVSVVSLDGSDTPLQYTRSGLDLTITLNGSAPDPLMSVIKVSLDGAPRMIPTQSVQLSDGSATIAGSDIVGHLSPKGRGGFTSMDGYVVNPTDAVLSASVQVAGTGISPTTDYRISAGDGDEGVVVSGAELLAGPVEDVVRIDARSTQRIRIQYADPGYYADPLNISGLSYKVSTTEIIADVMIAVTPASGGTIVDADGVEITEPSTLSVAPGTEVSLTAQAAPCHTFTGWLVDDEAGPTDGTWKFEATRNVTIAPVFEAVRHTATFVDGTGKVVASEVACPLTSLPTATDASGAKFTGWAVEGTTALVTLDQVRAITKDTRFVAQFKAAPTPTPTPTTQPAAPFTPSAPYTLPGTHVINGRTWFTQCESYSQTKRCTTRIWATTVVKEGGRFIVKPGFAFNNMTYLPGMTRAQWVGNPLGATGTWTARDGRQWRTECDTAATGGDGCRSYTMTTVYRATPNAKGGFTFTQSNQWVFTTS